MNPKFVQMLREAKIYEKIDLEREYGILKLMNTMLGRTIKFDDFDDLHYRIVPEREFMVLSHQPLGISKIIKYKDLANQMSFGPSTFAEFLDINGAVQVDATGKPLSTKQKRGWGSSIHGHDIGDQMVWKQVGTKGFWKQVPAGA